MDMHVNNELHGSNVPVKCRRPRTDNVQLPDLPNYQSPRRLLPDTMMMGLQSMAMTYSSPLNTTPLFLNRSDDDATSTGHLRRAHASSRLHSRTIFRALAGPPLPINFYRLKADERPIIQPRRVVFDWRVKRSCLAGVDRSIDLVLAGVGYLHTYCQYHLPAPFPGKHIREDNFCVIEVLKTLFQG